MIKTLVNHGNSMALIIDKPLLDILKINPSEPLEVITDGSSLIVSPVRSSNRYKRFQKAVVKMDRNHGDTFRRLAG